MEAGTPKEADTPLADRAGLEAYVMRYDSLSFARLVREDVARYRGWVNAFFHLGFWLILSYRFNHVLYKHGLDLPARLMQLIAHFFLKCEINRKAVIGPGFAIFHCMDILVAPYCKIGKLVTLNSGSFVASKDFPEDPNDYPVLDDGVVIGTGAKVIGPIFVGREAYIGPNAVVMKNIPAFSNVMPPTSLVVSRTKWKFPAAGGAGGTGGNTEAASEKKPAAQE